jgi:hypothetical protein
MMPAPAGPPRNIRHQAQHQAAPGLRLAWDGSTGPGAGVLRHEQQRVPVLAIRDNPRFDRLRPDCVQSSWVQQVTAKGGFGAASRCDR